MCVEWTDSRECNKTHPRESVLSVSIRGLYSWINLRLGATPSSPLRSLGRLICRQSGRSDHSGRIDQPRAVNLGEIVVQQLVSFGLRNIGFVANKGGYNEDIEPFGELADI